MNIIIILLLFQCIVSYQAQNFIIQDINKGVTIPKYTLNLDLQYEERWKKIIQDYKSPISNFWKHVESIPKVSQLPLPLYEDKDFMDELKVISDLAGVSFQTSQIISQMYELLGVIGCTSLIVRNQQGQIFHSRNLDFQFAEFLSQLLAQIDFQSNGQTVYSVDMIVGTVIAVTGMRPNSYSITLNARDDDSSLIDNLKAQLMPPCYLLLQILKTKSTYQEALKELQTAKIASNAYFIIAGISGNQGSVLERDKDQVHLETTLTDTNWFICQTNYDREIPDPELDQRRTPCEKNLKALNQIFTESDLFKLLNQRPVFAIDTISTNVMIPKINYFSSTKWFNAQIVTDKETNFSNSYKLIFNMGLTILLLISILYI